VYLNDPDGNGIELYWDKPREQWPYDAAGNLEMVTDALNLEELLALVV
jgi:catechol 2,3-dioxygenase